MLTDFLATYIYVYLTVSSQILNNNLYRNSLEIGKQKDNK